MFLLNMLGYPCDMSACMDKALSVVQWSCIWTTVIGDKWAALKMNKPKAAKRLNKVT